MTEFSFRFLVPSWWEIEITVAAAVFLIAACWFITRFCSDDGGIGYDRPIGEDPTGSEHLLSDYKVWILGFLLFSMYFFLIDGGFGCRRISLCDVFVIELLVCVCVSFRGMWR